MTPHHARLRAEQLPLGETLVLGSQAVTEQEIIDFASAWDPQYFHVDATAARESYFEGIIASGIHTLSIYQRLGVRGLFERYDVIAGKEARRLRFLHPVRPGDVLTCSVIVDSVEHDGHGTASVITRGTLSNQDGAHVLSVEMEALIASGHTN